MSICVISTSGVSPISERIAGGLSCEIEGAKEVSIILKRLLDLRLAFVRPLRLAVLKKLLQHWKADFAVVQGVTQIAAFIHPGCRNPRKRQTGKLLDVIFAARAGIGQDGQVRLVAEVEFPDETAADVFEPPAWFSEEVTGNKTYLNQTLATEGRPRRPLSS